MFDDIRENHGREELILLVVFIDRRDDLISTRIGVQPFNFIREVPL